MEEKAKIRGKEQIQVEWTVELNWMKRKYIGLNMSRKWWHISLVVYLSLSFLFIALCHTISLSPSHSPSLFQRGSCEVQHKCIIKQKEWSLVSLRMILLMWSATTMPCLLETILYFHVLWYNHIYHRGIQVSSFHLQVYRANNACTLEGQNKHIHPNIQG